MAVIAAPKFKRGVAFCGEPVDGTTATCHRLPAHHGDHAAFVRGNGVTKPMARMAAKKPTTSKPKTITRGGVTYRLVAVRPAVTPEPVEAPQAKVAPKRSAKPAAKARGKPRVRVIPEAKSRRRVASTSGR